VAASEAAHQHGHGGAADQVPAGRGHVELLLEQAVVLADHGEEVAEVVRDERVAGPLREEAEEAADEHAAAHAGRANQVHVRALRVLQLDLHRRLHLRELGLDELRLGVALAVVLGQDVERLLAAVLADQPARALRDEAIFTRCQQRGDFFRPRGGAYKMKAICTSEGHACSHEGIFQP